MDSYVCRDPHISQHTLDGQMVVVLLEEITVIALFVNKKGAPVGSVHRCELLMGSRLDSHVLGATGPLEWVVSHDTATKNISCSSHETIVF